MLNGAELAARAQTIAEFLKKRTRRAPKIAFLLGSGWGEVASALVSPCAVAYGEAEGMPQCGVEGHAGNFVFGSLGGTEVLIFQGRFHLYEGKPIADVVLPVAIAAAMGAGTLILTNAAGGIDPALHVGDLMIIRDHINGTGANPLIGVTPRPEAPIFIDMSSCYDARLRALMAEECDKLQIHHREGVYLQLLGPSFETPAEIQAFRGWGAGAVGMSTAVEAIYARYLKMRVAAISCITNAAASAAGEEIRHADVLELLARNRERFSRFILNVTRRIAADESDE